MIERRRKKEEETTGQNIMAHPTPEGGYKYYRLLQNLQKPFTVELYRNTNLSFLFTNMWYSDFHLAFSVCSQLQQTFDFCFL